MQNHNEQNQDALVKTQSFLEKNADEIVSGGASMQQTKTAYLTAVKVQNPRNLDRVVENILTEAEFAGPEFYYGWGEGKNHIEGASVACALSVVREWGNCAVECDVKETPTSYIFTGHFIDLETGFTLSRAFRQSKSHTVYGRMDENRKEDIRFQVGQSKAIRNVVLNAMPKWLVKQAMARAKEAVFKQIDKVGIAAASEQAIESFKRYGIAEEHIIDKVGKPKVKWSAHDIENLRTAYAAINNGEAYAEEIFPALAEEKKSKLEEEKPAGKEQPKKKEAPPQENVPDTAATFTLQ